MIPTPVGITIGKKNCHCESKTKQLLKNYFKLLLELRKKKEEIAKYFILVLCFQHSIELKTTIWDFHLTLLLLMALIY